MLEQPLFHNCSPKSKLIMGAPAASAPQQSNAITRVGAKYKGKIKKPTRNNMSFLGSNAKSLARPKTYL